MSDLIEKVIQEELYAINEIFPECTTDMGNCTEDEMEMQEASAKASIKTVLEQLILSKCTEPGEKTDHMIEKIREFATENGIEP